MSVKKYIAGLAAAFALGLGAGYCLSNGVEQTCNDTKYFAYKSHRAMIAAGDVMNEAKPDALRKVDEAIINVGHGMTMEEAKKKHEEMKSDLDSKIGELEEKRK